MVNCFPGEKLEIEDSKEDVILISVKLETSSERGKLLCLYDYMTFPLHWLRKALIIIESVYLMNKEKYAIAIICSLSSHFMFSIQRILSHLLNKYLSSKFVWNEGIATQGRIMLNKDTFY